MSRESHKIKLLDINNSKFVDAILYSSIESHNIDDFVDKWLPIFNNSRTRLKKQGIIIEDAHWDWNYKVATRQRILAYEQFVIEIESETQGMMIINTTNYTSRIEKGKPLVYIEYLTVAPWNRKAIVSNPKYKLVGSLLFYQAIGESIDKGFEGRIGLHSLPGAVGWYIYLGLIDFGLDESKKMKYFELEKGTAVELLNKLNN